MVEVVDGSEVDVLDPSWAERIKTIGIYGRDMIAVKEKNGREYAFQPCNDNQRVLFEQILEDLAKFSAVRGNEDESEGN